MKTITVRELELNLDLILGLVEKGETYQIIDKDKNVIAYMVPPEMWNAVRDFEEKKLDK